MDSFSLDVAQSMQILEFLPDAIIIVNQKGKIVYANKQCEQIFGYQRKELLDQSLEILIPESFRSRHAEHRNNYFQHLRMREMGTGLELYGQRKNLMTFPVEISLSPIETNNEKFALAVIRDVTERKMTEAKLAKLNKDLISAARRAGMAEIANSVLHNVGNILNSVTVSIGLVLNQLNQFKLINSLKEINHLLNKHHSSLEEYLSHDENAKLLPKFLVALEQAAEQEKNEVIDQIQNMNKRFNFALDIISKQHAVSGSSIFIEPVLVEDVIESVIMITNLEQENILLTKDIENIPPIMTDKNKLMQILINIILNTKEALLKSTNLSKCVTISAKSLNQSIIILVVDNGVGISPENLNQIFDFAFTTKKDGLGLGLHNCLILAEEIDGSLEAKSDGIEQGATFTLTLPK